VEVTVCLGTYGDSRWAELALKRAVPSIGDGPWVHVHAKTLAQARNEALANVQTPWVCFLDADDELTPGFFDHMARGTADIRVPSVSYVVKGRARLAHVPRVFRHRHRRGCQPECLRDGNWLVIGSVARTDLIRDVGGFREWPVYEDWDLWLRCYLAGGTFQVVPKAIYRAHVSPDSRNRSANRRTRGKAHADILEANGC
jgi:cellulose synthase/poly-beta-1,6-N-acetylglucosamine synthase-like glycosyltransferase